MRGTVIAVAVLLYAAAVAVTGAALRLPVPSGPTPVLPPVATPPAPRAAPASPPPSPPSPQAVAADDEQLQSTMRELAREQAASRELVAQLRATVTQLRERVEDGAATGPEAAPAGRMLARLGGGLFSPGQADLAPAGRAGVLRLLPELRAQPGAILSVEGHTDSQPVREPAGKPFKDNADLSVLRARSVAALLLENGLPAKRIRVTGWGDTCPLAANDSAEGRERNRRVEIRLLPAVAEP